MESRYFPEISRKYEKRGKAIYRLLPVIVICLTA